MIVTIQIEAEKLAQILECLKITEHDWKLVSGYGLEQGNADYAKRILLIRLALGLENNSNDCIQKPEDPKPWRRVEA